MKTKIITFTTILISIFINISLIKLICTRESKHKEHLYSMQQYFEESIINKLNYIEQLNNYKKLPKEYVFYSFKNSKGVLIKCKYRNSQYDVIFHPYDIYPIELYINSERCNIIK